MTVTSIFATEWLHGELTATNDHVTIVRFKSYRARKYLKSASLNNYFYSAMAVYINEQARPVC